MEIVAKNRTVLSGFLNKNLNKNSENPTTTSNDIRNFAPNQIRIPDVKDS